MSKKEDHLTFVSGGNAKLDADTVTFSIPAGHSCPGAYECLARVDPDDGRLIDGPNSRFRCFAASQESTWRSVRESRWHNFTLLKEASFTKGGMKELILKSLTPKAVKVRVHVSGDFFSQAYFDTWIEVANERPDTIFYAYTKSLRFWINRMSEIPNNLRLTASRGGKFDHLIDEYGLPDVEVIFHPSEANGREIDHDDSHASAANRKPFALLLHGSQPSKSEASKAMSALREQNIQSGYSREKTPELDKRKPMPDLFKIEEGKTEILKDHENFKSTPAGRPARAKKVPARR